MNDSATSQGIGSQGSKSLGLDCIFIRTESLCEDPVGTPWLSFLLSEHVRWVFSVEVDLGRYQVIEYETFQKFL